MIKRISFVFLFFILWFSSLALANEIITVISPRDTSVFAKSQIVEGKVEGSFVKKLRLIVEPFLPKEAEKNKSVIITVSGGYFREKVDLFPGLNIIKLSTLGGQHKVNKPIFLISARKPDEKLLPIEKWGSKSPIIFTSPQELKLATSNPVIKGVVTDPALKLIEVVIMNTMDFLVSQPEADQYPENQTSKISSFKKGKIFYKEIPVENGQFSFPVELTEGLNIIIAKPRYDDVDLTNVQIKTLIYERLGAKIILDEPEVKNNDLILKGRIINPIGKKARVNVYALVEDELETGKIYPKTLVNKEIKINKDGTFILKTSLKTRGKIYTIKSSPTITVWADGDIASKTLIKWW